MCLTNFPLTSPINFNLPYIIEKKLKEIFSILQFTNDDDALYLNISYYQFRHSNIVTGIYIFSYVLVFLVGLIGNLLVIQVIFRVPRMRTVTNLFIANLAFADLLVICFCMPATLMSNLFVRKYRNHLLYMCVTNGLRSSNL